MKISQKGIDLIKHFESLHDGDLTKIGLQPKLCPAGVWTVGYGHAVINPLTGDILRDNQSDSKRIAYNMYDGMTKVEAEALLKHDLIRYENVVKRRLKIEVSQTQFDALVSHTYNTGGSETLFKLVNENNLSDEIRLWFTEHYITANGVKLAGLERRRLAEWHLYNNEIDKLTYIK